MQARREYDSECRGFTEHTHLSDPIRFILFIRCHLFRTPHTSTFPVTAAEMSAAHNNITTNAEDSPNAPAAAMTIRFILFIRCHLFRTPRTSTFPVTAAQLSAAQGNITTNAEDSPNAPAAATPIRFILFIRCHLFRAPLTSTFPVTVAEMSAARYSRSRSMAARTLPANASSRAISRSR
jgi:hypothetical protein